ncbi:hypothetical protein FACS189430_03810 [Bacteroidia bacterium]|nr:hypothetical protein FACS189430_03810 [Bacteroidia bacterium]
MTAKIGSLSEISKLVSTKEKIDEGVLGFMGRFKAGRLLKPLTAFKTKGISLTQVFTALCLSRFQGLSVFASQQTGISKMDENTMYRMMNNPLMNWRSLLWCFAGQFLKITSTHGTPSESPKCFVIDDTDIVKTGKKIENVSKIHQHTTGTFAFGFKMLVLAFWDGKSLLPINFSFHRESKKNNYGLTEKEQKAQFSKKREERSFGHQHVKEVDMEKGAVALSMLKTACKRGLIAAYVLTDSWFVSDDMIKGIRRIRKGAMHLVGMCKMDTRKFTVEKRELNSKEIILKRGRKTHHSRIYKSDYITVYALFKGTPVKLFYIKYHRSKDWKLLLTTDLKLSFAKAMEIYQIRWSIEVMFKECKQYLRLGKAQNIDFDGQIADAAITLITHIVLSLNLRFQDYETMGGLFRDTKACLIEMTIVERILQVVLQIIAELLEILSIDVEETIAALIDNHQNAQKVIILLNAVNQQINPDEKIKNVA